MNRKVLIATLSAGVAALYVLWRLSAAAWDPVGIFELGSQYSESDPEGSDGYDGQFTYFIAVEPDPQAVAPRLDVPAYRYQRILLPLLGRMLALGNREWIPWALIAVTLAAHWLGTWAVCSLLANRGVKEWYGLSYGLWVGLVAPVGIGLAEPMAYGLAAWGLLLVVDRQRPLAGTFLLGAAGFTKETTLIFLAALVASEWSGNRDGRVFRAAAAVAAAHLAWQLWLLSSFGSIGVGSGGAWATGFEWIPFMGLLRIGTVSTAALVLYLVVFGPAIVLPTVWGVVRTAADWLRGSRSVEVYALLGHGVATMAMPFSTFREPLGIVRFADGLVLSLLIYAATIDARRPLRYSLLWIAWLALLVAQ